MKVNFPLEITASDKETRTITGKIVTWNEQGNTSAGKTVFAKDSIAIKPVKLLLEHDRTRPIGKSISFEAIDNGIIGKFAIADTQAGTDSLVEAAEGLRSGLSVGVMLNAWDNKDGALVVTSANLIEISLVTDAAIKSAGVTDVAASDETNNETEKEGSTMTEPQVEEVKTEDTDVAVEASDKPQVLKSQPLTFTAPRSPIVDKASYVEHSIKAKLGNEDSRQYVLAADTTSNNAGLIPTPQLGELINPLSNADRGFIDALSRGTLPNAGMTFELPKMTQVPTMDDAAEGNGGPETDMTNSFLSVPVKKFAGRQTFSVELFDRSANPDFFSELVRQMEFAYAKASDLYVTEQIALATNVSDYGATNTAANLTNFVALTAGQIYSASLGFARNLVVSPDQWSKIMSYAESNGRPIYNAQGPTQNAAGQVGPQSLRGNVLGLDLYVSRSIGVAANTTPLGLASLFSVNPDSFTWYESPRFRLQTNIIDNAQIEVLYYGYGALAQKVINGIRHNDDAAL